MDEGINATGTSSAFVIGHDFVRGQGDEVYLSSESWIKLYPSFMRFWLPKLTPIGFKILTCIAVHTDPKGKSFPSLTTISEFVGHDRKTVGIHVKKLEEVFPIRIFRSKKPDGSKEVNRYAIDLRLLSFQGIEKLKKGGRGEIPLRRGETPTELYDESLNTYVPISSSKSSRGELPLPLNGNVPPHLIDDWLKHGCDEAMFFVYLERFGLDEMKRGNVIMIQAKKYRPEIENVVGFAVAVLKGDMEPWGSWYRPVPGDDYDSDEAQQAYAAGWIDEPEER